LRHLAIPIALAITAQVGPSFAQTTGSIYGSVQDEQGSALPGATLTLEGMGAPQITVVDVQGEYRFLNLDPGTYYLKAALDGFSTVEQPNVIVALNRNVTINFTLSSAVEELITITSETPLLDQREFALGTVIPSIDLEKLPTARDPWALLNQTPGVLTNLENVGGSSSGKQMMFLAPGSNHWDNDYLIDGVQVTDVSATGSSSTYYDFEQFESIDIATGGADVTKATSGVALNMVTRRGTNEFRGTARFLSAKEDGLGFLGGSTSDLDCADLAEGQDCNEFTPNSISSISEYGFEAGGAAIKDRLWFWGSYGVQDIALITAGGQPEDTTLENESVKINAQLSSANSAVASWNNADKTLVGRGVGPTRQPETAWDQRGPTAFWRVEDTHIFNASLFLTGSLQKTDGGFALTVKSDCRDFDCPVSQEALLDSDGVYKQNFWTGYARRPERAFKMDGSYFLTTGDVSHELKFGGRVRESDGASNFIWPGRNILHIAGENFGVDPGPIDFFQLYRGRNDLGIQVDYNSLWIQDTISAGRWTVNVGARYDLQDGVNHPGTTGPSAVPDILPTITFDQPVEPPFDWETITPRLGATYALGEDRDTLLRASFSQFPQALGLYEVAWNNPALGWGGYGAYAYFLFVDGPENDNIWQGDEPYSFLFGWGYDPKNPSSNLNSISEDFSPEMTTEVVLGVEHSFLPELVVGATYTWREIDDVTLEAPGLVRPAGTDGAGRPLTAADFVSDGTVSSELPDGTVREVEVFAIDPSLERTGFFHLRNDSRTREYNGLALNIHKRLADRWSLRGYVNWGETEWKVPQSFLDNSNPNPDRTGADKDGAVYMAGSGAFGRGERYLQSSWQASLTGLVQVAPDRPWGVTFAGNVYAREGYALPWEYRHWASDGSRYNASLMDGATDRYRLDDLITVDLRAEKEFAAIDDVSLTLGLDLFNALNEATPLSRDITMNVPTANYLLDALSPRIWKLGVRVRWR
jgi:hypothetical protein